MEETVEMGLFFTGKPILDPRKCLPLKNGVENMAVYPVTLRLKGLLSKSLLIFL